MPHCVVCDLVRCSPELPHVVFCDVVRCPPVLPLTVFQDVVRCPGLPLSQIQKGSLRVSDVWDMYIKNFPRIPEGSTELWNIFENSKKLKGQVIPRSSQASQRVATRWSQGPGSQDPEIEPSAFLENSFWWFLKDRFGNDKTNDVSQFVLLRNAFVHYNSKRQGEGGVQPKPF